MPASRSSPFHWQGTPSIFSADHHFTAKPSGKTLSQNASDLVAKRTAERGVSPGFVCGITRAERIANIRPVRD